MMKARERCDGLGTSLGERGRKLPEFVLPGLFWNRVCSLFQHYRQDGKRLDGSVRP